MKSIESLHDLGVCHNDIKPDNITIGLAAEDVAPELRSKRTSDDSEIYLIDFGLSSQFVCPDSGLHVKNKKKSPFSGNRIFASSNAIEGQTPSRRDDILSIVYTLSFMISFEQEWIVDQNLELFPLKHYKYFKK